MSDKSPSFSKPRFPFLYSEGSLHEVVVPLMFKHVRAPSLSGVVPVIRKGRHDAQRLQKPTYARKINGSESGSTTQYLCIIYKALGSVLSTEGWKSGEQLPTAVKSTTNNLYLSELRRRELVLTVNHPKIKISFRLTGLTNERCQLTVTTPTYL